MKRLTKRLQSGAADYAVNMATLTHPQRSAYRQKCVDRLTAYDDICFDADGKERITVEELSALVKAQHEGLVVVLAVDTNVFIVQDNHIYQFRVYDYSLVAKNDGNTRFLAVCEECDEIDDLDFWTDDIGKTVFLTRAEAEAALGGGGDGCTDAH